MSITTAIVARWVEVTVRVPYDTDYDLFDYTNDWRMVVFSNKYRALECQTTAIEHKSDASLITMKLRERDYSRLVRIIG